MKTQLSAIAAIGIRRVLLSGLVVLSAAAARGVEVEYASDDDPAIKFAANELKRLLGDVPGRIALCEDASMEAQAWRLKTNGGRLTITGRDGMGIAYGVFTFLEKYAGIHWYAPDTEEVPDLSGWRLPKKLDERGRPAFSYREMFVARDYMDSLWRLRNKESNRASFGVGIHNGSPFDCHTFAYYAKALREKRPDLFKGRPNAKGLEGGELCMTDEETRDLVADEMCRYIESDAAKCGGKPRYTIPTFYDLSQNDGASGGECMCPGCKALFESAGSYAGPNIAFVNAVSERVRKRHPEVTVQTFAYSYTANPPTNDTIAADNVVVRYCDSRIFHPLLPESPNGRELETWSRHARQLGIWSYWRKFHGSLFPCLQPPDVIARELRFCRRMGVTRYYAQNDAPLSRSFAMLQHWLFLKLADDPSQDEIALVKKFLRGYYGRAAVPMGRYLKYLTSRQDESGAFLDREFFEKANAWMDEAEALAKGDERTLRHIRWERIVIDRSMYEKLAGLIANGYVYDREKVLARFLANLKDQVENWCGFGLPSTRHLIPRRIADAEAEARLYSNYPVGVPPEFDGLETVALEWNQIVPDGAVVVDDPDSAGGSAFYNPKCDYKLPYSVGFFTDKKRGGSSIHFSSRDDVPQDEKFHLHRLGEAVVMSPFYFHFDQTWQFRRYMQTVGIVPSSWEVFVSLKFQGPAFVEGFAKENRVLIDRVFYVKGRDPMSGYRKCGDNLVPQKFRRTIEVAGAKAGAKKWNAKRFSLGDPTAMENGFFVRGTVSYSNVAPPAAGVARPFAGLWATSKDGRNAFMIPCCNFYTGTYEKSAFSCLIDQDRLRSRVREAAKTFKDLDLTFRINLLGQEDAVVKIEDLEIFPVTRDADPQSAVKTGSNNAHERN